MSDLHSKIKAEIESINRYATRYVTRTIDFEEAIKSKGIRLYLDMVRSVDGTEEQLVKASRDFVSYVNQFPTRRVNVSAALRGPGSKMLSRLENILYPEQD